MNQLQQSGYYYYIKSTILFFTNNGEKEYDTTIQKQQNLAWLDLNQEARQTFEQVALFCTKNCISLHDKKTQRVILKKLIITPELNVFSNTTQPQKPPIPLFLYFRVVEQRLRQENPTLKQAQIFKKAEQRWKNDLIQRIKDQFSKIHQILDLVYKYDIMMYKRTYEDTPKKNINEQILKRYQNNQQPGIKYNVKPKQSITINQNQQQLIKQN